MLHHWLLFTLCIHGVISAPFLDKIVEKFTETADTLSDMFGTDNKEQVLAALTSRPLLDDKQLEVMKQTTVFSAIAYCDANLIASWTCKLCQMPESNASQKIQLFQSNSTKVQGYVAVHPTTSRIIVGFRGTSNDANKLNNLKMDLTPSSDLFGASSQAQVHKGFLTGYLSVRNQMTTLVQQAAQLHPDFKILITGHSLGGALATLAAVDVVRNAGIRGDRIHLSTIGEPRIGNSEFVNAVKECQFSVSQRGVNKADVIPHLPLSAISEYRHRPGELWTFFDDKTYSCQDQNNEDKECSTTLSLPSLKQDDHLVYYGMKIGTSACK